jgi:hypothetical protein
MLRVHDCAKKTWITCCVSMTVQKKLESYAVCPWLCKRNLNHMLCVHDCAKETWITCCVSMTVQKKLESHVVCPWLCKRNLNHMLCPWLCKRNLNHMLCVHDCAKETWIICCVHDCAKEIWIICCVFMAVKKKHETYGCEEVWSMQYVHGCQKRNFNNMARVYVWEREKHLLSTKHLSAYILTAQAVCVFVHTQRWW